jgi:hypothetical protein
LLGCGPKIKRQINAGLKKSASGSISRIAPAVYL